MSHQLPIWVARRSVEGRGSGTIRAAGECALGSVTSLTFADGQVQRRMHTPAPSGSRADAGGGRVA